MVAKIAYELARRLSHGLYLTAAIKFACKLICIKVKASCMSSGADERHAFHLFHLLM